MSFTCSDAVSLALTQNWFDETLDEVQILTWCNDFLRRIVKDSLWQENDYDLANCTADTWYDLPADFIRMVEIHDASDLLVDETMYIIRNGKIKFYAGGAYTATYIQYPAALTTVSANVPLPDPYLYPLTEYIIFKFYNMENDDKERKNEAIEYENRYKASLKDIYDKTETNSETESFQVRMRW